MQPILLFNEADALISKRHMYSHSTSMNVENAIQNILLEELENFEGIFFATTNMISNFDRAFARRFLFKVEFQTPGPTVKEKIWQSKLEHLTKNETIRIARKYTLTGGQIDNISKKCRIYEVLNNRRASMQQVEAFCNEETFGFSNGYKLGFKK
jgi:SpoVK/Ycf46/Vps4 family AAA+-type ATPase